MNRKKIGVLTTSTLIVNFFLIPILNRLQKSYDVTLLVKMDDRKFLEGLDPKVIVQHIPIERNISPSRDLKTLWFLFRFFKKTPFDLIYTVAPKAGLVGVVAAWFAGIKHRVHVFQGEVWLTRTGIWRLILKNIDRLVAMLATDLQIVSASERDFLISEKIISAEKSQVLGHGSICGVDLSKFKPDLNKRAEIRKALGIPENDLLLLFIGRLNRDKGVIELLNVFKRLSKTKGPGLHLVLVGPNEDEEVVSAAKAMQQDYSNLHIIGYSNNPQDYMASSDLLVLPSHREGFGLVIIEAAAVKVPAVATRIYGIQDAIAEGETGTLFDLGNEEDLFNKINFMLNDNAQLKKMGEAAYIRCSKFFNQEFVIEELVRFYEKVLADRK